MVVVVVAVVVVVDVVVVGDVAVVICSLELGKYFLMFLCG